MFVIILSLSFISAVLSVAPIPLVTEDPGYRLDPNAAGAAVRLEAFIEHTCPDSAYTWPILKQLQEDYGPENLEVVMQHFSLPYHRQSWLTSSGFHLVRDRAPQTATEYMDIVFDNQFRLGNTLTRDMTEREVAQLLGEIQEPATGIDAAEFAADVFQYSSPAVRQWKFGARRGIAGTAWFVVNNIDLAVNPSDRLSYDDWREILDPLMPANKK